MQHAPTTMRRAGLSPATRATGAPATIDRLRDRVLACWLGKAVGGTVGVPFEGVRHALDLTYYDPVPTEMLANDDLDLQVLWAAALADRRDRTGAAAVDRHDLAAAFYRSAFPWDEYGVFKRNTFLGLAPPHTGRYDNWFFNGMGAAIRSEVWACLAAGDPALAAKYAYEDACLDHAGPGVEAEQFFAALEAAAFVESDAHALIDTALGTISPDGQTARCVRDVAGWWAECCQAKADGWKDVRTRVLARYGHTNFTDTTANVGFTVLGFLEGHAGRFAGDDPFGRAVCVAVNCGEDTDCTGATAGSILGILRPDGISDRWLKPLGRKLVVDPRVPPPPGQHYPETIDGFADLVLALRDDLAGRPPENDQGEPPPIDAGVAKRLEVPADVTWLEFRRGGLFRDDGWLPPEGTALADVLSATPDPRRSTETRRFPGTWATLSAADFASHEAGAVLLTFAFDLPERRRVRVFANSPDNLRAWLDGDYAFGREAGGRMGPSVHRIPLNQGVTRDLPAGRHELSVMVSRPVGRDAEWVVGVGDPETLQWVPAAMRAGPFG